MQTLKIEVEDTLVDNILWFLQNFKGVKVKTINEKDDFLEDIRISENEILKQLQQDPFNPSLKTYKLKGELSKYHSCSLTYEYRIVLLSKLLMMRLFYSILVHMMKYIKVFK